MKNSENPEMKSIWVAFEKKRYYIKNEFKFLSFVYNNLNVLRNESEMDNTGENVLFIVTSLVRPKNTVNSVFTAEERFQQTIGTINSIRNKLPQALIVVLEASFGEKTLVVFNDVFMFYIHHARIDHSSKSVEEAGILEIFLTSRCYENLSRNKKYLVCKISGRYELDQNFDIANLHPNKINYKGIETVFFAFPSDTYTTDFILKRLKNVIKENNSLFFKEAPNPVYNNILNLLDVIGVSGCKSTGRFLTY